MSEPGRSAVELLRAGLPVVLFARGGSMWPAVRTGDRLRIEPGREPRRGDLVAYLRGDVLVVHRARGVTAEWVVVRGDAASFDEAPLRRSEVLGVVTEQRTVRGTRVDHARTLVHAADAGWTWVQPRVSKLLVRARAWRGRSTPQPLSDTVGEGADGPVGEGDVEQPARE